MARARAVPQQRMTRQIKAVGGEGYNGSSISAERERALLERWRTTGDKRAHEELVRSQAPILHSAVRRYRDSPLDLEDLANEAWVSVVEALNHFDPDAGWRFVTYSKYWIIASIRHYAFRNWHMLRFKRSNETKVLFTSLTRMMDEAEKALIEEARQNGNASWSPSEDEITEHLAKTVGMTTTDVTDVIAQRRSGSVVSLDAAVDEDGEGSPLSEFIAAAGNPEHDIIERIAAKERLSALEEAMSSLSPRKRLALDLALSGQNGVQIGKQLGISRQRVQQVVACGVERVSRNLDSVCRTRGIRRQDLDAAA